MYTAFADLDEREHGWGESWRFDGYVFAPAACELTLRVAQGMQLDPRGTPSHAIELGAFRLAVAVGDRRGNPRDPVRSISTLE